MALIFLPPAKSAREVPALVLARAMDVHPQSFTFRHLGNRTMVIWKRAPRPRELAALDDTCSVPAAFFVKSKGKCCTCRLESGMDIIIPRQAVIGVVVQIRWHPPHLFAA